MLLCLGGRKEHLGGKNMLVKIFAFLGCYEAWVVVSYQRLGANLSVPFPEVKQSKEMALESGPDSLPALSVTITSLRCVTFLKNEIPVYISAEA